MRQPHDYFGEKPCPPVAREAPGHPFPSSNLAITGALAMWDCHARISSPPVTAAALVIRSSLTTEEVARFALGLFPMRPLRRVRIPAQSALSDARHHPRFVTPTITSSTHLTSLVYSRQSHQKYHQSCAINSPASARYEPTPWSMMSLQ